MPDARQFALFADPSLALAVSTCGYAVVDLQRGLKMLADARRLPALDPKGIDGEWGANTTAAVNAFKSLHSRAFNRLVFNAADARNLQADLVAAGQRVTALTSGRPEPWRATPSAWRALRTSQTAAARVATIVRPPSNKPTASSATPPYPGEALNSTTTIRRGMCGPLVRYWQIILTRIPGVTVSGVSEDGNFGAGTEAATKVLQRAVGVRADGVVGTQTRTAVRSYLNRRGITVTGTPGAATATAAPCAGTVVSGGTSGSASVSGSASDTTLAAITTAALEASSGGDAGGTGTGNISDKVLNFFGDYGPVLAIGVGVAAFALLGNSGGRR